MDGQHGEETEGPVPASVVNNAIQQSPRRQRAHSAPEMAMYSTSVSSSCPYWTHPTRSMKNGMATTVPQNLLSKDLSGSQMAQRKQKTLPRRVSRSSKARESFEMKCCRINVLLVVMQLCLGVVITALAFYMETLTPSLQIRECPYWAGIPLLVAGVIGSYFCATDFAAYAGSVKVFIVKAICFTLTFSCIFLSMVAAVFAGIHGSRIANFLQCRHSEEEQYCECVQTNDSHARIFVYEHLTGCDIIFNSLKDYLILQCALSSIASGVCIWFDTLLWKARYQTFYSSLRFGPFPYSRPNHPYNDSHNPSNPISNSRRPSPFWLLANQSQLINKHRINDNNLREFQYENV